jgi:hypothetical protein
MWNEKDLLFELHGILTGFEGTSELLEIYKEDRLWAITGTAENVLARCWCGPRKFKVVLTFRGTDWSVVSVRKTDVV